MNVERFAAFSVGNAGGNPAAVVLTEHPMRKSVMQALASDIGYSESVFATPGVDGWQTRYFAPEMEVPFCGHATIALGGALTRRFGSGLYRLNLNDSVVTVEGSVHKDRLSASFQSPPTSTKSPTDELVASVLSLFNISEDELDTRVLPRVACAGARHFILSLKARESLKAMNYDVVLGRELMNQARLTTIMLIHAETDSRFHVRNAFASGGIYEDPATGAAAAAFAGYLRELRWAYSGGLEILQGEDMGICCRIVAEVSPIQRGSIRISGEVRVIEP